MKIDCCVCDLDGTLLNSKGEISFENMQALQELKKHGVKIVLATGRNDVYVKALSAQLGIEEPIIACNGALVRSPMTNEILYHKYMEKKFVEKMICYCFDNGYDFTASVCDHMFCAANSERVNIFHHYNEKVPEDFKISICTMEKVEDLPTEQVLKMFIWKLSDQQVSKLKQRYNASGKNTFVISEKNGLDITDKAVNKGAALRILAEKYQIKPERIAVFGDHHNDISMMRVAGYAFAMENAEPEVKEAANYVTKTNDEHGVAYAIKNYLLV